MPLIASLPEQPPRFPQSDRAPADIHRTLREVFGFDEFRSGQEAVIRQILNGRSALALFPTGSGKSLCFQLSALHLDGLTLVVSPLIALMKDQIDFLETHQIRAARLDSSVPLAQIRTIDAGLRAGEIKVLYVAPERFSNERFIQKLQGLKISLMVIDEAHCISEWGHNFRPDYLKLARIARNLQIPRVLALTATATPPVAADICREFGIAKEAAIHTGFYRPNLVLRSAPCSAGEQLGLLVERLRTRPRGPTIVYVTLQRTAVAVAEKLARGGFPARAYHAGMENEARHEVQDWFMKSRDAIVVATIAFGMGIDKSDIRYVYHYNLPKSLENYSQEIGRAGRDGVESVCEILACSDDVIALENFTYGDTPDGESVAAIIDLLLREKDEFDVSTYELSRDHDVRPLVVTTLLTYLELEDVIEATAPFYREYQFQPLREAAEILGRFDADRAAFLKKLFAEATRAQTWYGIDIDRTAHRLQTTRDRVVKAFTFLEEEGDLVLKVAGLRQGYRIKNRPADLEGLKRRMVERFEMRERTDVARVRQVVELAASTGCLVRQLLSHFGETFARDCGHCGWCHGDHRGHGGSFAAKQTEPRAARFDRAQVKALARQHSRALRTPRQIARFLCGLSSPLLTQNKLHKDPLFGTCGEVPFPTVMSAAAQLATL